MQDYKKIIPSFDSAAHFNLFHSAPGNGQQLSSNPLIQKKQFPVHLHVYINMLFYMTEKFHLTVAGTCLCFKILWFSLRQWFHNACSIILHCLVWELPKKEKV